MSQEVEDKKTRDLEPVASDCVSLKESLRESVRDIDSTPYSLSADEFLEGNFLIPTRSGPKVAALVRELLSEESSLVGAWFEENTSDQPTYSDDPTWKDWWVDTISSPPEGLKTYGLFLKDDSSEDSELLAVVALKAVEDWHDGNTPTLYVNGLRINPNLMPYEEEKREYFGVGTSLLTFAVGESQRRGLLGIGVNSSLGVEKFYESLGMKAIPAHDGKRTYFTLKGEAQVKGYLEHQYRASLLSK